MATHGSLTKAGKVRGQTPKVEGRKIVGTNSKLRNKSNFRKRFVLAYLVEKCLVKIKQVQKKKTSLDNRFIDSKSKSYKTTMVIKYWYRTLQYD